MGNISEQKRTKATISWQSPSVYSIYTLLDHVTYMRSMLKVTYAKSDLEKKFLRTYFYLTKFIFENILEVRQQHFTRMFKNHSF
jgi:hypothetical protein